jgi:hypothetical protein
MRMHPLAVALVLGFLLSPSARAQQAPAQPALQEAQPAQQAAPPTAESMGVSLKGVRQQSRDMLPATKSSAAGMRYDFYVDVFGTRPAIEFFKEFDLSTQGGVKWGGVTHQEILDAITPFPFRNLGGVDLLAIGRKK